MKDVTYVYKCPFCDYTTRTTSIGVLHCGPHVVNGRHYKAYEMKEVSSE